MSELPGHALDIRNVLAVLVAGRTIVGDVGVRAVVHVVLLAVGLLEAVGWISGLQLVQVKGFVAGTRERGDQLALMFRQYPKIPQVGLVFRSVRPMTLMFFP